MFSSRFGDGPSYQGLLTILSSRITYVGMIILGLLLGGWFAVEDQYVRCAPTTFRKAACVIEDSTVDVQGRDRFGMPTSFAPVITFTFTAADGRERTVAAYRLYEGEMSEDEACNVAYRYEPGQETFCYYDPANPNRAVMSLEADRRQLGLALLCSALLLFGGVAGWAFLEVVVKPSQAPSPPPPDALDLAMQPAADPAVQSDALRPRARRPARRRFRPTLDPFQARRVPPRKLRSMLAAASANAGSLMCRSSSISFASRLIQLRRL